MKTTHNIPLLNDHHTHTSFYLALRNCLDLRNVKDLEKALNRIKELDEDVNVVLGWTFGDTAKDRIEKELPAVLICDSSLHNYIMNQKAKDKLIDEFPEIVNNIENLEWIEHNLYSIIKFIPQIKKITEKDVHEFFDYMLKENQIYKMQDLLLPNTDFIDLYEKTGYLHRVKIWIDLKSYKTLPEKYKDKIAGFKIFLDGAISPGTAAINGYVNSDFDGGIKLYTDEELKNDLKFAESEGKAVAAHALGEIVIEQLVDIIEQENIKLPCMRIEHAQYISPEVALKCKKLGIVLSMQINFSEESILFKGKLTDECLKKNNPFRMLIDQAGYIPGVDLIFSSDGMPHGAKCALQNGLFPPLESQKLTLDEFIAGYCMETKKYGSITFETENEKVIDVRTKQAN
ncbi:MAG: amidohydrolase family protein [Victivallales bacterium]|nr:amidohydrolase family protein [Victivallales bacterium]MCF7889071.1 amidohydrolase family protein [Victivallales bacterium]